MMRSNLLSESRLLQLPSISSGKSAGGLLCHQFPSTKFVKLQLFPAHLACRPITAVGHARASSYPVTRYEIDDIRTPLNWGINIVPERMAFVIERDGHYSKTLGPGIHFLIPFVDKIAYVHSMKIHEIPIDGPFSSGQFAPTKDNVDILVEGRVRVKIVDPIKASYEVDDPIHYLIQLAQSTVLTEFKKITVQQLLFEPTETLKEKITISINEVAKDWGLQCLCYEIDGLYPPDEVKKALEMRFETEQKMIEAEHKKRTKILEAEGDAEAILIRAHDMRRVIAMMSKDLKAEGGMEAACLYFADQYIEAISKTGQAGTTDAANPTAMIPMVCLAIAMYKHLLGGQRNQASSPESSDNQNAEPLEGGSSDEQIATLLEELSRMLTCQNAEPLEGGSSDEQIATLLEELRRMLYLTK